MDATEPLTQYAALPYAMRDGRLHVLLVTTRETGRWTVPKGRPKKKMKAHDLAARAAFEVAGVVGRVRKCPIGSFCYDKRRGDGDIVRCVVPVFPLEVEQQMEDWPEKKQRETRWVIPAQAALLVSEAGLITLMLNLTH